MWNIYKDLRCVVETALRDKSEPSIQKMEASLKLHKADFMDFIKNQPKSASDKAAVLAGVDKGLQLMRSDTVTYLTTEMKNEAVTLSELFDLNEVVSVDLLLTAESQQYFYPGLSRGLVAVLIYFQSKLNLASTFQMLLQTREGRVWDVPGSTDRLNDLVMRFTSQVIEAGFVSKILDLLSLYNETSQLTRLQLPQFLAIGPQKHKFKVIELLREITASLGSCLFYLSCQTGLSKADTLLLLGSMATIDQSDEATSHLSDAHLAVLMSLLYSFDLRILEAQQGEDWTSKLPLLTDPSFHKEVTRLLTSSSSSSSSWTQPGLHGVVNLAWCLTLMQLSNYHDIGENTELLLDTSISLNVFLFIKTSILESSSFFKEQYYVRRMHFLVTDFIVMMPLKVKEIRSRCENESMMMEGREAHSPPFRQLLDMISHLYKQDSLQLELSTELWCPSQSIDNQSLRTSNMSQRRVTLFKFIRLAGDMLTPPLYTAYINMLTGLSTNQLSAHCCFNLLKLNAMSTGNQSSIVSWDHFFSSLDNYYNSLKHEDLQQQQQHPYHPTQNHQSNLYQQQQHQSSSPFHQQPPFPQNSFQHHAPYDQQQQPHLSPAFTHRRNVISDDDVDGLIAVLSLISTVVEKDQDARVALTESNRGQSLYTIFGLITCSIPIPLKAALLRCMTSFAKSANVAADLWLMMEKAQLLFIVGRNGRLSPRGLHIEIDEMEPQTDEYPLTRAFIQLISTLTTHPLITPLAHGITPFINFLKDSIFLKAFSKSYKIPSEKWQVCSMSLQVLHRLVESHDCVLNNTDDPSSDPTAHLLALFYSENSFLKMIFSIIDQTSKSLNKHLPMQERMWVEQASLWCLRLIHVSLAKQAAFIDTARKSGVLGVGSTGLDQLLLSVNARTLKSDHVINLTRFLISNCNLPHHALHVSHILSHLSTSSYALPKIIPLLTSNPDYLRELLAAVAECIDSDEAENDLESQDDYSNHNKDENDEENDVAKVRVETRRVLMEMLVWSVQQPQADLVYLLCAFDLHKPIHKTQIQDPGINNFPRNLMHSLVNHLSSPQATIISSSPSFSLMAYKFIFHLVSDASAHASVLRFLRSHDFLYQQAASFALQVSPDGKHLPHLSWLLRSLVVDLKVSAANKQRSYVQKIVELFVKANEALSENSTTSDNGPNHFTSRIISVLRLTHLNPQPPSPCHLSIFHQDMVEQLVTLCEVVKDKGLRQVDIKLLYRHLLKQCNSLGANLASHKEKAFKDIEILCANVAERNTHQRTIHACKNSFISCKQLIEVILTACPHDILTTENRQLFIVAVLQTLLHKISTTTPSPELAYQISALILTLCCQLNRSFSLHSSMQPPIHPSSIHLPHDVSLLSTCTDAIQSRCILSTALQSILAGVLNYLLSSAPSHFKVRSNLYGAVLYCINISQKPFSITNKFSQELEDRKMQKYLAERDEPYERLSRETMATVAKVAPQLLSVLCKDSSDGHDISKMLAMTVLDVMMSKDMNNTWLEDTTSKGFIHYLINSLIQDNNRLEALMNKDTSNSPRELFIFQSKIGLLCRISTTSDGAKLLLSHDLMSVLSQCSVIDAKLAISHFDKPYIEGQFVPSALSSYRHQILFPTLSLSLSLLTSLGSNNVMAIEKIFPFVMGHYELLVSILSDHHSIITLESLQELQLVSALVSKTAHDVAIDGSTFMNTLYGETKVCTNKLQRLMGALMARFGLGEVRRGGLVRKVALESLKEEDGDKENMGGVGGNRSGGVGFGASGSSALAIAETKVMILIEEILCNSLSLSQTIISKSNSQESAISVIFAPSISDAIIHQNTTDNDYNLPSQNSPMSLGILVQMLMDASNASIRTLKQHNDTLHRHLHVAELSVEEVKELSENQTWMEKLPLQQRHSLLAHKLLLILEDKAKELKLLRFIIENSLLLLWRHLDFYLVTCQSAESALLQSKYQYSQNDSTLLGSSNRSMLNNSVAVDALMVGVPRENLNVLKRDSIAWINDSFFKSLMEVEMGQKNNDGFIGALVRKIKRIVTFNTQK